MPQNFISLNFLQDFFIQQLLWPRLYRDFLYIHWTMNNQFSNPICTAVAIFYIVHSF